MDRAGTVEEHGVLARLAFDEFYRYLGEHYGTPFPRNPYNANRLWRGFESIADMCLRRGWDVVDFVRQSFPYINKTHYYITPYDILGVARRYVGQKPKQEWEGLQTEVLNYEGQGYTEADILMNPFFEFPAWFRCLYPEEPSRELLDTWGELARNELRGNVTLRNFVKEIAPEALDRLEGVEPNGDN